MPATDTGAPQALPVPPAAPSNGAPVFLPAMSPDELVIYRNACADDFTIAKQALAGADAEIARRFGEHIKAQFAAHGKDHGTLHLTVAPGIAAKAVIDRKVEWDQAKLRAIAAELTWPEIAHLFKIEFTVPEKNFGGMMPGPLKDKVADARTTKPGTAKITLERVAESM